MKVALNNHILYVTCIISLHLKLFKTNISNKKNVDIKISAARRVSWITFNIIYCLVISMLEKKSYNFIIKRKCCFLRWIIEEERVELKLIRKTDRPTFPGFCHLGRWRHLSSVKEWYFKLQIEMKSHENYSIWEL